MSTQRQPAKASLVAASAAPNAFGPNLLTTRRLILKGLGASLALPFLPSALPRSAWGAGVQAPLRLLVAVMPNGQYTPAFQPVNAGANYDLPPIITAIKKYQSRFSVLTGVHNLGERDSFPEHAPAMGTLLTDNLYNDQCLENLISFDQVLADALGAATPFRSLQLTVKNAVNGSSACIDKVSWGNGATPYPPIEDPLVAFERLFGAEDGLTPEEIEARNAIRGSILDAVLERTASLRKRLNTEDLVRLDQYETGIRDLETRLSDLSELVCEEPEAPGATLGYEEATQIQYELIHKAFECDLTRYVTFLQGPSLSTEVYTFSGTSQGLHELSHESWYQDQSRQEYIDANAWQFEQFVGLLELLANTTDIDGSDMLSNTVCVYTTEFSEANQHLAYGPPHSLAIGIAGGENAGIVQGVHRVYDAENTGNLWLSLINYLGVEQSTFGVHGDTPINLSY
jgi:Protein of unknown function (DUF1552)